MVLIASKVVAGVEDTKPRLHMLSQGTDKASLFKSLPHNAL